MLTYYTKYFKLSSKCSQYRFKAFQNEIKFLIVNFDIFKRFLLLPELGKLAGKLKICQLSLSFAKTELTDVPQFFSSFALLGIFPPCSCFSHTLKCETKYVMKGRKSWLKWGGGDHLQFKMC